MSLFDQDVVGLRAELAIAEARVLLLEHALREVIADEDVRLWPGLREQIEMLLAVDNAGARNQDARDVQVSDEGRDRRRR